MGTVICNHGFVEPFITSHCLLQRVYPPAVVILQNCFKMRKQMKREVWPVREPEFPHRFCVQLGHCGIPEGYEFARCCGFWSRK